ncbi:MAG: DsbA family protein [Paracoccaceae bacterium]
MKRVIVLICAVVTLGFGAYLFTSSPSTPPNPLIGAANAQEAGDVDTSGIIEMVQGSEDAPVTMIEYASYTCPHCAAFHSGPYKKLKADYIDTGKVKFIYREVYFDRYGLWGSMIARCAGPDRFFGVTDLLYSGQSEWTRAGEPADIIAELRKIGRQAGVTDEQLDVCLQDNDKAQALVAWYQANAEADGVQSTPSFVIDGERQSNMSYDEMSAVIETALGN